jgi:uncharacterized membrane protein
MKNTIAAMTAGLVLAAGAQLQADVDFDKQIKPLLESKCIDCHAAPYKKGSRTKKPKAGLRIDTRENLLKGSDDGVVVKPGDGANSNFYKLTTLPAEHDDIMPPKDDPLTKDQQALLKAWIDEGVKWTDGVVLQRKED